MLLGGFDVPLWLLLGPPTLYLFYWYHVKTYSRFKKAGIPGPKPYPIFGTAMELYGDNLMNIDTKLMQKYGKFVGTFEGSTPVMMVYDGPWLKEAFVKNFNVLHSRRPLYFGGAIDDGLFSIGGEHWKSARKLLSSEFSSGKLKKMMPAIQCCEDKFVDSLRGQKCKPVDIRRRLYLLTLDVISRTAFGFDAQTQTMENNQFAENAYILVDQSERSTTMLDKIRQGFLLTTLLIAPDWLAKILVHYFNLGLLDQGCNQYFEQLCSKIIEERREDSTPASDFLQTLANSYVEAKKGDPDTLRDATGRIWTRKGLTKPELIGNAILFLFAGFQTTADTMFFLFYELALHPEIQQRMYEEIMKTCDSEELTPEQVNSLKYVDRAIQEAMRLYPQAIRFDRVAEEDVQIDGVLVEKGTVVTVPVWSIQRDPDVWEDPEEFDPDRFLPERLTEVQSASYMPFGLGNRHCIGNRLALMEMKMTMISTLKNFFIEKTDQTPARPLAFKPAIAIAPLETVMVAFKERN